MLVTRKTVKLKPVAKNRTVTAKRQNGDVFTHQELSPISNDKDIHYKKIIRDISDKTGLQSNSSKANSSRRSARRRPKSPIGIADPLNNIYMTAQLLERELAKEEITRCMDSSSDLILSSSKYH